MNTEEINKETDEKYMRRCLELAANGRQNAKPNPMVGAVIVSSDGRIIGEGYHVRCGEGHAEVNAFASVKPEDEALLGEATVYVSLEPCSHWGKTPPCADLVISKHVRRVVCGCIDPFAKVQGRGVKKLRDAGIEVTVGVLEKKCLALNKRFITFNTHHRPYILLKWAQSADGFISGEGGRQVALSSPFTQMLVHKLRAENDAILVGRRTFDGDHPQLNVRLWAGRDPERLVLTHHCEGVPEGFRAFDNINSVLEHLYSEGKQSLIVEGGAQTLQAFLDRGLWDEIRVETAPFTLAAGVRAPQLPEGIELESQHDYDGQIVRVYRKTAHKV